MSANAVAALTLQYTAPGGPVNGGTASASVTSVYTPMQEGIVDIPAATPADTKFSVAFGTVDLGALLIVKNKTLLDVGLRINESTADAVLVAGTVLVNLDNVVGDQLSVELLAANGDAGTVVYDVFRVSNTQVRVVAHDSVAYGFVNTSVASVRVHNNKKYTVAIPAGGFLAVGGAAPAASAPYVNAKIVTTDVTVGTLETFVFGPS